MASCCVGCTGVGWLVEGVAPWNTEAVGRGWERPGWFQLIPRAPKCAGPAEVRDEMTERGKFRTVEL